MPRYTNRAIATLSGALALSAAPFAAAPAQTAATPQYVVTYGELAQTANAKQVGASLLAELTRLALNDGAQFFAVSTQIGRPSHFTLIEVWRDAASYAAFTGEGGVQQVFRELQPLLIAPLDERDGNLVAQ